MDRKKEIGGMARTARVALGLTLMASALYGARAGQEPGTTLERVNPVAKELLDRAIQAMGGPAFLGAKNLTTRGRVFIISDGATSGFARFENTDEYPDKRRFAYGDKADVVLVNNGERGWQVDRFGVIRQEPAQVRRWIVANRYSLENVLRAVIHEPDLLIQDGGVDFVDHLPAHAVEIVDTRQVRVKLYLHKTNFRPIRITYRVQDLETREWQDFDDVYGDYREIQGVQTPYHITRFRDGRRYAETFRNAAEYNRDYPLHYFSPAG
ncbi:MAG: hypothetical protein HYS61_07530 [Acidobacteria bacterium]|nr:hypothetical protein [Acidobacteriota bacterium]